MAPEPEHQQPTDLHQQNRELLILNAIAATLNASLDLGTVLAQTLARVAELFDLRTGWVFLFDETTGSPYLAASQNLPPGLAEEPQRLHGGCLCLDRYRKGRLTGDNVDVLTCSRLKKLVAGSGGLRFHASIPLDTKSEQLGVLNLASSTWRELGQDEMQLLCTVGDMLSLAIERTRLHARHVEVGVTEERNRLAREIHDTLAQSFAGIALQLEAAEALLDEGSDAQRIRGVTQAALALARSGLDEARCSVLDLRAAPLEGCRLDEALSRLCSGARTSSPGVEVMFEAEGVARRLPSRFEVGLYRIAQEALTNALRHAQAHQVRIALTQRPGEITLVVEDDGRGFDPEAITGDDRFGLVGQRERAALLGGRVRLESSPGVGTRVVVEIPFVGNDSAPPEAEA